MLIVADNTSNLARFTTTSTCLATLLALHFADLDIEYFDFEILA